MAFNYTLEDYRDEMRMLNGYLTPEEERRLILRISKMNDEAIEHLKKVILEHISDESVDEKE